MSTSLKHALDPSFALLFAVGTERFYKVLDPVVLNKNPSTMLDRSFYMPMTMILFTLIFGSLSSISNAEFVEANPSAPLRSKIAWFSLASVFVALVMFYLSTDLTFVTYWWLGYAVLCLVNALWNWYAVQPTHNVPHVAVNLGIASVVVILFALCSSPLSRPVTFYVLWGIIFALKRWQRTKVRVYTTLDAA